MIAASGLGGELLHYRKFQEKRTGAFIHYIHSTFFSREVAKAISIGYLAWFILVGVQTVMIEVGKKYWGVWTEYNWMGQASTAYFPFLIALTIGIKASFSEEVLYRMFAISWGKMLFKRTIFAVLAASIIWGFAHSSYPVYPMWFRGVEVTILGFVFSFFYLQYGLIVVLVAHYLFDAFWSSSGYLLGSHVQPIDFYGSLIVMLLPLFFALVAFYLNRPDVERVACWKLNKNQLFNLNILRAYLAVNQESFSKKATQDLREELASHGWDIAVVEEALKDRKSG